MKLYDNSLIGTSRPNTTNQWFGGDNIESYVNNKLKMPIDWYYRDKQIIYKINSTGHRCKNLQDVDLDNYILFAGCSHTLGTGVELENSYAYRLANKLNCDYYNLGINGSGIDVLAHNLIVWFATISKKPKLVVIQWPDYFRYVTGNTDNLHPQGFWDRDKINKNFLGSGLELGFFDTRRVLYHTMIKAVITVPIVSLSIGDIISLDHNTITGPIIDFARDLCHPGIKSHENFAESIHDYLINTLCLSFCQNPEEKS